MVTINDLVEALQKSWNEATSSWGIHLPADNKARGQCVVSSLVVQDYLGGDIVRVHAIGGDIDENHTYNRLPDGTVLDTTAMQYVIPVTFEPNPIDYRAKGFESEREWRLSNPEIRNRYEALRDRVSNYLKEKSDGTV